MSAYTQPALFPDTDITGSGQPQPWPTQDDDAPHNAPAQADTLPFEEDAA